LDGDSNLKQQATSHSLETDRVAAFFQAQIELAKAKH
jgi:hypothetical protein